MPGVRSLLLALAGVSLAPAVLAADASTDSSDVHVLKTDTFKDFIKEHDLVLAEFYAPWCGHCKALAPEYEKAATELKGKNIQLAKVDCTEEADLCQEYGVEGYPTLKVFRGLDSHKPYNGARKSPAITSYMVKQSLPSVSVVTAENFEEVKSLDKVVVVAFIGEDDKETNKTYTALADSMRDDVLFAGTSSAELAKKEGVSLPAVVLYKEFDDRKDVYDGKFEAEALKAFIKSSSTPLVGEVGPETYSGYMSAGIPLAYIFADTAEEREQYASDFKDLAKKLKGKINFATIDSKAFGAHAANLNLIPEKFPAFAIQDTVSNKKYPFDQEKKLTKQDITKFVEGVIAGDIAPSVKSEAVPETNDGPVTVIVAHTYEEIVMNKDKDVLVEFYAPWCGHCKALAPKYDQLGSLYKDNKDFASKVTIAKVDATANDIPDEIQGFPTIKLFPAGDKDKPVEYTGSRTIEDLANFVRDNGKHKVDAYDEKKVEKDGSDVTGKPKDAEAPPKPSDAPESEEKADKEHEEL